MGAQNRAIMFMVSIPVRKSISWQVKSIIDAIGLLINYCEKYVTLVEEKWTMYPDEPTELKLTTIASPNERDLFLKSYDNFKSCSYVSVNLTVSLENKNYHCKIYAGVNLSKQTAGIKLKDIRFEIPRKVWNHFIIEDFLGTAERICYKTKAHYAAIDQYGMCPVTFSGGCLYEFASQTLGEVLHQYIPAICWWQLIPESLLSEKSLNRLSQSNLHKFNIAEKMVRDYRYCTIHMKNDIYDNCMEGKEHLRSLMIDSCPALDLKRIKQLQGIWLWDIKLQKIPFTEDEKERLRSEK